MSLKNQRELVHQECRSLFIGLQSWDYQERVHIIDDQLEQVTFLNPRLVSIANRSSEADGRFPTVANLHSSRRRMALKDPPPRSKRLVKVIHVV